MGGPIVGNDPTGIDITAHPGEWVIKKSSVDKYGPKMMQAINQGKADLPKFATGGPVDDRSLAHYATGGAVAPRVVIPRPSLVSVGGGETRNYYITVNALDPKSAANAVNDAIIAFEDKNGRGSYGKKS